MSEQYIGKRRFVDGETRLVFEDERGQFVLDDDGAKVHGVWLVPETDAADEPVVVE